MGLLRVLGSVVAGGYVRVEDLLARGVSGFLAEAKESFPVGTLKLYTNNAKTGEKAWSIKVPSPTKPWAYYKMEKDPAAAGLHDLAAAQQKVLGTGATSIPFVKDAAWFAKKGITVPAGAMDWKDEELATMGTGAPAGSQTVEPLQPPAPPEPVYPAVFDPADIPADLALTLPTTPEEDAAFAFTAISSLTALQMGALVAKYGPDWTSKFVAALKSASSAPPVVQTEPQVGPGAGPGVVPLTGIQGAPGAPSSEVEPLATDTQTPQELHAEPIQPGPETPAPTGEAPPPAPSVDTAAAFDAEVAAALATAQAQFGGANGTPEFQEFLAGMGMAPEMQPPEPQQVEPQQSTPEEPALQGEILPTSQEEPPVSPGTPAPTTGTPPHMAVALATYQAITKDYPNQATSWLAANPAKALEFKEKYGESWAEQVAAVNVLRAVAQHAPEAVDPTTLAVKNPVALAAFLDHGSGALSYPSPYPLAYASAAVPMCLGALLGTLPFGKATPPVSVSISLKPYKDVLSTDLEAMLSSGKIVQDLGPDGPALLLAYRTGAGRATHISVKDQANPGYDVQKPIFSALRFKAGIDPNLISQQFTPAQQQALAQVAIEHADEFAGVGGPKWAEVVGAYLQGIADQTGVEFNAKQFYWKIQTKVVGPPANYSQALAHMSPPGSSAGSTTTSGGSGAGTNPGELITPQPPTPEPMPGPVVNPTPGPAADPEPPAPKPAPAPTKDMGTPGYALPTAPMVLPDPKGPIPFPAPPDVSKLKVLTASAQAQLGGVKSKSIYVEDGKGGKYLFKPSGSGPMAPYAGEAVAKLAALLGGPDSYVPVWRVTMPNGKTGSLQPMLKAEGMLGKKKSENCTGLGCVENLDVKTFTDAQKSRLLREHVLDWLVSNHDTKGGNFLMLPGGGIVGIDKERAFREFGTTGVAGGNDIDTDWDPCSEGHKARPIYYDLYDAYQAKKIDLNPMDALPAIEQMEALTDEQYLGLVSPYLDSTASSLGWSASKKAQTQQYILDRKHNLRADFEKWFTKMRAARGEPGAFKFPEPGAVAAVSHANIPTPTTADWGFAHEKQDGTVVGGGAPTQGLGSNPSPATKTEPEVIPTQPTPSETKIDLDDPLLSSLGKPTGPMTLTTWFLKNALDAGPNSFGDYPTLNLSAPKVTQLVAKYGPEWKEKLLAAWALAQIKNAPVSDEPTGDEPTGSDLKPLSGTILPDPANPELKKLDPAMLDFSMTDAQIGSVSGGAVATLTGDEFTLPKIAEALAAIPDSANPWPGLGPHWRQRVYTAMAVKMFAGGDKALVQDLADKLVQGATFAADPEPQVNAGAGGSAGNVPAVDAEADAVVQGAAFKNLFGTYDIASPELLLAFLTAADGSPTPAVAPVLAGWKAALGPDWQKRMLQAYSNGYYAAGYTGNPAPGIPKPGEAQAQPQPVGSGVGSPSALPISQSMTPFDGLDPSQVYPVVMGGTTAADNVGIYFADGSNILSDEVVAEILGKDPTGSDLSVSPADLAKLASIPGTEPTGVMWPSGDPMTVEEYYGSDWKKKVYTSALVNELLAAGKSDPGVVDEITQWMEQSKVKGSAEPPKPPEPPAPPAEEDKTPPIPAIPAPTSLDTPNIPLVKKPIPPILLDAAILRRLGLPAEVKDPYNPSTPQFSVPMSISSATVKDRLDQIKAGSVVANALKGKYGVQWRNKALQAYEGLVSGNMSKVPPASYDTGEISTDSAAPFGMYLSMHGQILNSGMSVPEFQDKLTKLLQGAITPNGQQQAATAVFLLQMSGTYGPGWPKRLVSAYAKMKGVPDPIPAQDLEKAQAINQNVEQLLRQHPLPDWMGPATASFSPLSGTGASSYAVLESLKGWETTLAAGTLSAPRVQWVQAQKAKYGSLWKEVVLKSYTRLGVPNRQDATSLEVTRNQKMVNDAKLAAMGLHPPSMDLGALDPAWVREVTPEDLGAVKLHGNTLAFEILGTTSTLMQLKLKGAVALPRLQAFLAAVPSSSALAQAIAKDLGPDWRRKVYSVLAASSTTSSALNLSNQGEVASVTAALLGTAPASSSAMNWTPASASASAKKHLTYALENPAPDPSKIKLVSSSALLDAYNSLTYAAHNVFLQDVKLGWPSFSGKLDALSPDDKTYYQSALGADWKEMLYTIGLGTIMPDSWPDTVEKFKAFVKDATVPAGTGTGMGTGTGTSGSTPATQQLAAALLGQNLEKTDPTKLKLLQDPSATWDLFSDNTSIPLSSLDGVAKKGWPEFQSELDSWGANTKQDLAAAFGPDWKEVGYTLVLMNSYPGNWTQTKNDFANFASAAGHPLKEPTQGGPAPATGGSTTQATQQLAKSMLGGAFEKADPTKMKLIPGDAAVSAVKLYGIVPGSANDLSSIAKSGWSAFDAMASGWSYTEKSALQAEFGPDWKEVTYTLALGHSYPAGWSQTMQDFAAFAAAAGSPLKAPLPASGGAGAGGGAGSGAGAGAGAGAGGGTGGGNPPGPPANPTLFDAPVLVAAFGKPSYSFTALEVRNLLETYGDSPALAQAKAKLEAEYGSDWKKLFPAAWAAAKGESDPNLTPFTGPWPSATGTAVYKDASKFKAVEGLPAFKKVSESSAPAGKTFIKFNKPGLDVDATKAALTALGLTIELDQPGGGTHYFQVDKAELAAFQAQVLPQWDSGVPLGPVPTPPPPPPPPQTNTPFALAPRKQPKGVAEINTLVDAKDIGSGVSFSSDGSAVEGQTISAKRYIGLDGKPFYQFLFKLREPDWKNITGGTADAGEFPGGVANKTMDDSLGGFLNADYDAAKDAYVVKVKHNGGSTGASGTDSNFNYRFKGKVWKDQDSSISLATNNHDYAFKGYVTARLRPLPGESLEDAFKRMLNKMKPGMAAKVLHQPSEEELKVMRLSKLYWSLAPQESDALSESERTVANLTAKVKALGITDAQIDSMHEEEVCPGYHTTVLPGRADKLRAMGAKYLTSGSSSPAHLVSILVNAYSGIVQRGIEGVQTLGSSDSSDIHSGGADSAGTRFIVKDRINSNGSLRHGSVSGPIHTVFHPRVLDRLDYFVHTGDEFMTCNPNATCGAAWVSRKSAEELVPSLGLQSSEVNFRHGVGAEDIVKVACESATQRTAIIQALKNNGVTQIRGIPVEEFVVTGIGAKDFYQKHLQGNGY